MAIGDGDRRGGRRRGPGERAGLERDAVLVEARRVVERAGVAGLTMRALAKRLGVAPNALYSHFADKGALVDAVLDATLAEIPTPDVSACDWREGLVDLMRASRALLLRHADLIPLYLSRPGRGTHAIRLGEVTLALLARGGVTAQPAVDALRILLVYTFGFAAQEAPRRQEPHPEDRQRKSEAAFRAARTSPRLSALAQPLARHPGDETFEKGLRWLIAGIAGA